MLEATEFRHGTLIFFKIADTLIDGLFGITRSHIRHAWRKELQTYAEFVL